MRDWVAFMPSEPCEGPGENEQIGQDDRSRMLRKGQGEGMG